MAGPADRVQTEAKYYGSLLALALGTVVLIALAWVGSERFAASLAQNEAERRALRWADRAIASLQLGEATFEKGELAPEDKARLYDLLLISYAYRYVLLTADGRAFWSSKPSRVGAKEEGSFFRNVVAKGKVHKNAAVRKASDMDKLIWRRDVMGVDPASYRDVYEVFVPVMAKGRFVGAVEVYVDMTDLIMFFAKQARIAALALAAAFGSIFLAVGAMMFFYVQERRANARALSAARDEALASESSARDFASQLQRMHDDVVKLNRDLASNMKTLSETQDEVVRRGRMALLGQLTATVAHEVRNPLTTIRTAAYLLGRKLKDKEPSVEQALQRVNRGVVRCDNIIAELLDFARVSAPLLEPHDVDAWLARVLDEERERLPAAVAIEFKPGLGRAVACFDTGPMQRVLVNLLSNAAEAMVGRGDYPARSAVAEPRIVVSTRQGPRGIEIEVADNGPGIASENINRILEPLFTTKNFGVGLGLPAVQRTLEQHGGGLDVRSQPGLGATFVAWFPATQTKREAA